MPSCLFFQTESVVRATSQGCEHQQKTQHYVKRQTRSEITHQQISGGSVSLARTSGHKASIH